MIILLFIDLFLPIIYTDTDSDCFKFVRYDLNDSDRGHFVIWVLG